MKKSLLLLSALALCCNSLWAGAFEFTPAYSRAQAAPATVQAKADAAEGSMEFRYYGNGQANGLSVNGLNSGEVWVAVCMPKASAATFAGNKITSLNVVTPVSLRSTSNKNYVTDVTVFISNSRNGDPVYTQKASLGAIAEKKVNLPLTTAYEISGEEDVWFGYYFTLTRNIANNNGYVVVENAPGADPNSAWVKLGGQWDSSVSTDFGPLLIGAMVEGDHLPVDVATISSLGGKGWVAAGNDYSFDINVRNGGSNPLLSVDYEYTFNNGEAVPATYTFPEPVASNAVGTLSAGFKCDVTGMQLPISVKLTKVNGVAVDVAAVETTVDCYDPESIFKQNVLIEEGTGTWCPNCPLGIVLLEELKETYTDGSLVLVGVHNGDEMQTNTYNSFVQWAFSGFPMYMANRKINEGFYQSAEYNMENFKAHYDELTSAPAKAKIELELSWASDDHNTVHATAVSTFAGKFDGAYKVAFIVVEDGVGPYNQKNNLTGVQGFGIWSSAGTSVPWIYNDVARNIYDAFGIAKSTINNPEGLTPYTFEYDIPVKNVNNIGKSRIVAALLDNSTREVVNVTEVELRMAGVDNIADDENQVSVRAEMGAVVVNGAAVTEVYTIDGRRAATAYGEAVINLPAGLYIVKADKLVKKVIVK